MLDFSIDPPTEGQTRPFMAKCNTDPSALHAKDPIAELARQPCRDPKPYRDVEFRAGKPVNIHLDPLTGKLLPGASGRPCGICDTCRARVRLRFILRAVSMSLLHPEIVWTTLTFRDDSLPDSDGLRVETRNFVLRLRRLRKKRGITAPLHYVSWLEANGENERPHFHLLAMSTVLSRQSVRDCWTGQRGFEKGNKVEKGKNPAAYAAYASKYASKTLRVQGSHGRRTVFPSVGFGMTEILPLFCPTMQEEIQLFRRRKASGLFTLPVYGQSSSWSLTGAAISRCEEHRREHGTVLGALKAQAFIKEFLDPASEPSGRAVKSVPVGEAPF